MTPDQRELVLKTLSYLVWGCIILVVMGILGIVGDAMFWPVVVLGIVLLWLRAYMRRGYPPKE